MLSGSSAAIAWASYSSRFSTVKRITTPKASGAEQALHSELLALYSRSGPDGFVGVQAYSDKEKNTAVVRAPSLTIIGESTPEVFFGWTRYARSSPPSCSGLPATLQAKASGWPALGWGWLGCNRPLKNVGEAASARQKQPKKRSLRAVNEHFEAVFNAAMAT
nr:hypothetical protein [Pseudomonas mendocina]